MAIFYTTSTALEEAIAKLSEGTQLGSTLRSPEWAAVPVQLHDTAFFTAAVENASYLAEAQDQILDCVKRARQQVGAENTEGESTLLPKSAALATALREIARQLGASRGTAASEVDPLCVQSVRLVVEFRVQSAQAYAEWKTGQDLDLLDAFPAQELVSLEDTVVPSAWRTLWVEAGGKLYRDRLVARKDDPIWHKISCFGGPARPFDLYSGIGIRDVDRFEAERLGVITREEKAQPSDSAFTADLNASVGGLPSRFSEALQALFGERMEIEDNTARWVSREPLANAGRWDHRWGKGDSRGGQFRAKDAGGSLGGGELHRIDRDTKLHPEDAARLLLDHPRHPTTQAFSDYLNKGRARISVEQAKRIDRFLRRMPPYQPEAALYRGLSKTSAEALDQMLAEYPTGKTIELEEYVTSGSKEMRTAMSFARKDGHGMILAILTVQKSARNVEPIAKALAPQFRHQQEVMFLRGSRFRVKDQRSIAGLPVPVLEEVSS